MLGRAGQRVRHHLRARCDRRAGCSSAVVRRRMQQQRRRGTRPDPAIRAKRFEHLQRDVRCPQSCFSVLARPRASPRAVVGHDQLVNWDGGEWASVARHVRTANAQPRDRTTTNCCVLRQPCDLRKHAPPNVCGPLARDYGSRGRSFESCRAHPSRGVQSVHWCPVGRSVKILLTGSCVWLASAIGAVLLSPAGRWLLSGSCCAVPSRTTGPSR